MERKILTGRGRDFEAVITTRDLRPVTNVTDRRDLTGK